MVVYAVGFHRLGYAVRKTSNTVVPVCATISWPCIDKTSRVIVEVKPGLTSWPPGGLLARGLSVFRLIDAQASVCHN